MLNRGKGETDIFNPRRASPSTCKAVFPTAEAGPGGAIASESTRDALMMGVSALLHRSRLDGGESAYLTVHHINRLKTK